MQRFFSKSKNLKVFLWDEADHLDDATLLSLAYNCPTIEQLSIGNCSRIKNETFYAFFQKCKKIKELNVTGCTSLSDDTFEVLAENSFLHKLDITGCVNISREIIMNYKRGWKKNGDILIF